MKVFIKSHRLAKDLQSKQILIFPTLPIKKYLGNSMLSHVEKARDKLHVANANGGEGGIRTHVQAFGP